MNVYNPKKVVITYNGISVTGFAEDTFLTIDQKEDGMASTVGCDGEFIVNIQPNNQLVIKISLMAFSETNDKLMTEYKKFREKDYGGSSSSIPTLCIKGMDGGTILNEAAWITRVGGYNRGRTANANEWTFETAGSSYLAYKD